MMPNQWPPFPLSPFPRRLDLPPPLRHRHHAALERQRERTGSIWHVHRPPGSAGENVGGSMLASPAVRRMVDRAQAQAAAAAAAPGSASSARSAESAESEESETSVFSWE